MSKDYRREQNRAFAEAYGPKRHPKAEIISSWTIQRDPTDLSILDFTRRARPYGWSVDRGMLCLELYYVRMKPFDPYAFTKMFRESEEEFQARMQKSPELEPQQRVLCMCPIPELLPETQEVRIDAYVDGSLIIEQYTKADVELRRALTREALSMVSKTNAVG